MVRREMRRVLFIGVDLQRDFTEPEGALHVEGAQRVLEAALRLKEHAAQREIPFVFTQDTHADDDPVFESFPPHAVLGTPGHDLAPNLGIEGFQLVPNAPLTTLEVGTAEPLLVHAPDHRRGLFGNLNADRLLEAADAEEHVVFGLPLELGVRAAVMGLTTRKKTTILVSDAIAHLDGDRAAFHLAAMAALGCHFLPLEAVIKRYA